MRKRSLVISALAALVTASVFAGCGSTYYFDGRVLPPSGIANRVLIAIQNPSPSSKGLLQFVDGYYDIRTSYNDKVPGFSISGYSGALPTTIQNMPEEQIAAVYGAGDGSFTLVNYPKEATGGAAATLNGPSSSVFISRNQLFVIAASQQAHVLTVVDKAGGKSYTLGLPGVNRVSINPGGTVMMAFAENSDYAYYPFKLQASQSTSLAAYYSTHDNTWPAPYIDCEPVNLPGMCLAQVGTISNSGVLTPTVFDRPVKAMFSSDGSRVYVLNCGPECGGKSASVTVLPSAPLIVNSGQQSGTFPSSPTVIPVPGGASNALINSTTMYVLGQQPQPDGLFAGNLTLVNLSDNTAGSPISVSDSQPGAPTKMILADDDTLWLGGIRCAEGERASAQNPSGYGCLTMFNTSTNTVTMIEPFQGDLTGLAALTGLHKLYIAEGGQVYIYSTKDGSSISNFNVSVTGTAYDVAYMDAITDSDNTDY